MRKNDLIKLLESIDGNPDVVIWNGFVRDYQHIDKELVEDALVKPTLAHHLEMCRIEQAVKHKNWEYHLSDEDVADITRQYKSFNWERNEFVLEKDIQSKCYKSKRVVYLQPKARGESHFDRLGEVRY